MIARNLHWIQRHCYPYEIALDYKEIVFYRIDIAFFQCYCHQLFGEINGISRKYSWIPSLKNNIWERFGTISFRFQRNPCEINPNINEDFFYIYIKIFARGITSKNLLLLKNSVNHVGHQKHKFNEKNRSFTSEHFRHGLKVGR